MRVKSIIAAATAVVALAAAPGSALAQQASLTLQNCDTKICYKNNTEWTLKKEVIVNNVENGAGNITWLVTATRGVTTDNIIEVNGYLTIINSGSADATIGNIVVNLQKRATPPGGQPTWVSAAADMADATLGDAATKAVIARTASQEDPGANASVGANNYTFGDAFGNIGGAATFIKTTGSGIVQFTDDNWNSAYSLVPEKVIPPGGSVSLLWRATFNNTLLGLAAGAQVRTESIVTFGNAGGRGDSGASTPDLDINGSGVLDADEAHVRSVPCRVSLDLPPLIACNNEVTLSDIDPDSITTPGDVNTVTYANFTTTIGGGTGIEPISATTQGTVSVVVDGGDEGGTICNTATLKGDDCVGACSITVGTFTFKCCTPVNLSALSCVDVTASGGNYEQGDFCGYTQGGWGAEPNGGNVGALLYANFNMVYPGGPLAVVEIGTPGASGYSVKFLTKTTVVHDSTKTKNDAAPAGAYNIVDVGTWEHNLTTPNANYPTGDGVSNVRVVYKVNHVIADPVSNPLPSGAFNVSATYTKKINGKDTQVHDYDVTTTVVDHYLYDKFTHDHYDYDLGVTKTALEAITAFLPAGETPGALTADLENPTSTSAGTFAGQVLALKFNVDFSAAGVTPAGLGSLTLCNTGTSLDGQTISQILAAANTALGGGALPAGYSIQNLSDLVTSLNEAFDNCTPTDWANSNLCP